MLSYSMVFIKKTESMRPPPLMFSWEIYNFFKNNWSNRPKLKKTCNFIKKRLQHRCFPVNITKLFRTRILRVCSHERWNELIPVSDFKPAWKQVLFTWSLTSTVFQNHLIFGWTCVDISFRVVFTWCFVTWNEIPFLSKWTIWNAYLKKRTYA